MRSGNLAYIIILPYKVDLICHQTKQNFITISNFTVSPCDDDHDHAHDHDYVRLYHHIYDLMQDVYLH